MRMDNNRIPEEQNYGDLKRQDFTVSNCIQNSLELILKFLNNKFIYRKTEF